MRLIAHQLMLRRPRLLLILLLHLARQSAGWNVPRLTGAPRLFPAASSIRDNGGHVEQRSTGNCKPPSAITTATSRRQSIAILGAGVAAAVVPTPAAHASYGQGR